MNDLSSSVQHLIEYGYTYIPIDAGRVDEAKEAFLNLLHHCESYGDELTIARKGEYESDLGYIVRDGSDGTDIKHFFHFALDICVMMSDLQRRWLADCNAELKVIEDFHRHLNKLGSEIGRMFDTEHSDLFSVSAVEKIHISTVLSQPYATSTLRSLWYPASKDQDGASVHVDRSLFTIHLGDEGGELLGRSGGEKGKEFPLSPASGQAVVFFGVKALYLTNGRIPPLWHESTVEAGADRRALVQFVQADIGFPVSNARRAYEDFYRAALR